MPLVGGRLCQKGKTAMQGDARVIDQLNKILSNELTAINQYFLHARMLQNWGFLRLGKKVYDESIGEMKHADLLVERILILDGLPNMQDLGKLRIGEDTPEILSCDLVVEMENQKCLKDAIQICEEVKDFVSREILENILEETEEHIDWIETQNHRIKAVTLENYLQEQMEENSS